MNFAITYTSADQLVYLGSHTLRPRRCQLCEGLVWFCLEGRTAAALKRGERPLEVGRRDAKGLAASAG
jgi:hypothetical protein